MLRENAPIGYWHVFNGHNWRAHQPGYRYTQADIYHRSRGWRHNPEFHACQHGRIPSEWAASIMEMYMIDMDMTIPLQRIAQEIIAGHPPRNDDKWKYHVNHRKEAIVCFVRTLNKEEEGDVDTDPGLFVDPKTPWLACHADAYVSNKELVLVKAYERQPTHSFELDVDWKNRAFKKWGAGYNSLFEEAALILDVTGKPKVTVFIWTPAENFTLTVTKKDNPDSQRRERMDILRDFHERHIKPLIDAKQFRYVK
jgi:hypothetical protein